MEKPFHVVEQNLKTLSLEQNYILLLDKKNLGLIRVAKQISKNVNLLVKSTTLEMQPRKNVKLILKQGLVQDYPIMHSGMFLPLSKHGMVVFGIPLKK